CGEDPVTFDVNQIDRTIQTINEKKELFLGKEQLIPFDPPSDVQFLMTESLPHHPNALTFLCAFNDGDSIAATYYSIGGGFVESEGSVINSAIQAELYFPIDSAQDLLHWCIK